MSSPSVTSRSFAVLGAFDEHHRALKLSDISRRSNTPLSTTHRLVAELVTCGALHKQPTGHYVVGRRLWDLGLLAPVQADLRETASPFLHDLFGATLETVHLAVRDGEHALYIDRLAGHRSVPILSTIGSRLPLHATGVGKVLLAHASDELQAQVLTRPLKQFTPFTVTSSGRLAKQLDLVRSDGYATTVEEMSLGACSVAVPIVSDGRIIAAVGFVVPDLRHTRARLVTALKVAARGIARSQGDPTSIR